MDRGAYNAGMKTPRIAVAAGLSVVVAGAPVAAEALAGRCDRPDAVCGPRAPDPADIHQEYQAQALNTGTRNYVDTGSSSRAAGTADFDALLYPEFVGQELRPYVIAGTQEGPDLW